MKEEVGMHQQCETHRKDLGTGSPPSTAQCTQAGLLCSACFSTLLHYFKCSPLSSNHPDLTSPSFIFKKALPLTSESKEKPLRWELHQFPVAELRSLWYLSLLPKVNSVHLLHSALGTMFCLLSRTLHHQVSPLSSSRI